MVTQRDSLKAALQSVDGLNAVRATSDQVANAAEPVAGGVELEFIRGALKGPEAAVHDPETKSRPLVLAVNVRTRAEGR